jgi:arabinogalactan endo-1,4-beta-galactosidase
MMKRVVLVLLVLAVALPSLAQSWLGGDISMMTSNARQGVIYKDSCGVTVDPYDLFKQQGWNMMRVRLFVDPQNAPGRHHDEGVCQDLDYVIDLCKTIKARGFEVMLDFHYSDTWADPAKQFTPKRWERCDSQAMADSVYAYTRASLLALKKAGVVPEMIQVGNEITNGMLWPTGKIDPSATEGWGVFCSLIKAGSRACREVCPHSQIIIHTEKAGDWDITRNYYRQLRRQGVDYDIIGLSYYPMWHGTIPNLGRTLDNLLLLFPDKPVMIVETAAYYSHERDPWAKEGQYSEFQDISPEGQATFTRELLAELRRHHNVTGLFWWFPEENAFGNDVVKDWLNRGLFNNRTGQALPAMREFRW